MKKKKAESQFDVVIDAYGRKSWKTKQFVVPQPPPPDPDSGADSKAELGATEGGREKDEVKTLTARKEKLELDKHVGKSATSIAADATNQGAGFYCDCCELMFNDSASYLDHLNGRKHYQKLGVSMKVEKASIEKVKFRLKKLKQQETGEVHENPTFEDIEKKLDRQEELAKLKRKKKKNDQPQLEEQLDFDAKEIVAFGLPPDFGSSKKH